MGSVITNSATSTRYARSIEEHRAAVARHRRWSELERPARESPRAAHVRPRRRRATCGTSTGTSTSTTPAAWARWSSATTTHASLAAVRNALEVGQVFAGQNEFEAEFGERLVAAVPWIESIRIGLTGTEMDLLAVRIARAATGRARVLRFVGHYHGWLDPLLVGAGPMPEPFGRPAGRARAVGRRVRRRDHLRVERPRVVEQVLEHRGQVACVLMEPMMCNTGLIAPAPGYLEGSRELCRRHGALLVDRRGDHRLPARPDRGAGLPRRQRRHHDLRQGGGVRVPDGRARDDARAARAPSGAAR